MKKVLFLLLINIGFISSVQADEAVDQLQLMIEASKRTVEAQQSLLQKTEEYLKLLDQLSADSQNKQLAFQMVQKASRLKQQIDEERMSQAYSEEFLKELSFFAKMGNKPGLPPAS